MATRDPHIAATQIICDAGGELVGRTRLQKVTYLAQLAGFGQEFDFEYRHYGPFSEDLARGMEIAAALGPVKEEEQQAGWGGRYSIYTLRKPTAAFLFIQEGIGNGKPGNPWHETRLRKPDKSSDGRLERAAAAYEKLRALPTPTRLPELPSP